MPHVNGSDGDDLGDADEIKVFKHDEECEEEKKLIAEERQSDSLTEDKSSLITEGESQSKSASLAGQSFTSSKSSLRPEPGPLFGRGLDSLPHASPLNMGYLMSPYPYHNGMSALSSALPSMVSATSFAYFTSFEYLRAVLCGVLGGLRSGARAQWPAKLHLFWWAAIGRLRGWRGRALFALVDACDATQQLIITTAAALPIFT